MIFLGNQKIFEFDKNKKETKKEPRPPSQTPPSFTTKAPGLILAEALKEEVVKLESQKLLNKFKDNNLSIQKILHQSKTDDQPEAIIPPIVIKNINNENINDSNVKSYFEASTITQKSLTRFSTSPPVQKLQLTTERHFQLDNDATQKITEKKKSLVNLHKFEGVRNYLNLPKLSIDQSTSVNKIKNKKNDLLSYSSHTTDNNDQHLTRPTINNNIEPNTKKFKNLSNPKLSLLNDEAVFKFKSTNYSVNNKIVRGPELSSKLTNISNRQSFKKFENQEQQQQPQQQWQEMNVNNKKNLNTLTSSDESPSSAINRQIFYDYSIKNRLEKPVRIELKDAKCKF